eukprot:1203988-Rhodomonas_salina.3
MLLLRSSPTRDRHSGTYTIQPLQSMSPDSDTRHFHHTRQDPESNIEARQLHGAYGAGTEH